MSNQIIRSELEILYSKKKFTRIYRGSLDEDGDYKVGVICGLGNSYLCMANVNDDRYHFDGFSVIKVDDITRILTIFDYVSVMEKTIDIPNFQDLKTIPLNGSMYDVLLFIQQHYPLVVVYVENYRNDVTYIGKINAISQNELVINSVSPNGEWNGISRFDMEDITQISFGGLYETALFKAVSSCEDGKKS